MIYETVGIGDEILWSNLDMNTNSRLTKDFLKQEQHSNLKKNQIFSKILSNSVLNISYTSSYIQNKLSEGSRNIICQGKKYYRNINFVLKGGIIFFKEYTIRNLLTL